MQWSSILFKKCRRKKRASNPLLQKVGKTGEMIKFKHESGGWMGKNEGNQNDNVESDNGTGGNRKEGEF